PLVLIAVISSIMTIANPNQLRKIGVKTIAIFLGTTGLAALIGLITAVVSNPGSGIAQNLPEGFTAREIPSFWNVILDLTPSSAFNDMAQGNVVPVIIFALFIGIAVVQIAAK